MSVFVEGTCLKSEIITRMVDLMKGAGWQDVSSNYATDFHVMYSKGESGDKDLYFQIRPTAVNGTNDVQTTVYPLASYRLINGYTPSTEANTAGVFERTSEAWRNYNVTPSNVDPQVELNYYASVNKDRIIINIYTPESLGMLPTMAYFGLPTHFTSEPLSRGVIGMTSYSGSFSNQTHISDEVAELPSKTASFALTNYCQLPPRSPNSASIHTPAELFFGNNSVGLRGKIDSLYFLPVNSLNDGDILRLGAKRYRATQVAVSGSNSFPSPTMIYQIS